MKKWIDKKRELKILVKGLSDLDIANFYNTTTGAIESARRRLGIPRTRIKLAKPGAEFENMTQEEISKLKKECYLKWQIPKTQINTKKKKPFATYLMLADQHIPEQNVPAINSVLHLMNDISFDGFFIVGDYMDMTPLSHWLFEKKKRKALEKKRLKADYIVGNSLLDEFDKRLPSKCDKRFFYGNHERFYYDFIDEYPQLEGLFDPSTMLHLKERGYTVYDDIGHIEKVGRLYITHGSYHTINYVKKHIDEFKSNVLHADMHSPRFRLEKSAAKEIALAGYCMGCLCDLNPDYLQGKPHKWAHGFAVVYFYDNGFFDVDLKRIVKGKFIFNNKLYDGNNKKGL